ncbi:abortive infection family protein [Curtobacterium flaccumfaciens]|uniref:abortive infection family protein n=1 Tax=Curtobacterium flaccumfaciens TaxID=2035 RepID=UPI001BDED25F|nr:abortive infection family protein [Curtobacterium flaccumfaciens pv. flaccumfaciens]
MLRNLSSIVKNISEARNAMGTGHGRAEASRAERRHARLFFNATVTVTEFIAETWAAREDEWDTHDPFRCDHAEQATSNVRERRSSRPIENRLPGPHGSPASSAIRPRGRPSPATRVRAVSATPEKPKVWAIASFYVGGTAALIFAVARWAMQSHAELAALSSGRGWFYPDGRGTCCS